MSETVKRLIFLGAICVPLALAQQTTATLTGTVSDPAGAAVPNVIVKATELSTNQVRETKSAENGGYILPFLPAGDYAVSVAATGFQAQKIDRVTLQIQQTLRVDIL